MRTQSAGRQTRVQDMAGDITVSARWQADRMKTPETLVGSNGPGDPVAAERRLTASLCCTLATIALDNSALRRRTNHRGRLGGDDGGDALVATRRISPATKSMEL